MKFGYSGNVLFEKHEDFVCFASLQEQCRLRVAHENPHALAYDTATQACPSKSTFSEVMVEGLSEKYEENV